MSTESIGFLNHETCWTASRVKEAFDQDCLELKDLGEAFERLSSDALDVAVIPARMIHGNQLKLLSSGLVVSGAMNQNRPFHVMVSDDRVRHLPKASISVSYTHLTLPTKVRV